MNRLISFFSRPLPQNDNGNWLQAGLIAGAIVFFLLFFLRPFGLGQFEGNLFIVALCFSMLSVAVTWCYGECVFKPWVRRVKTSLVSQPCFSPAFPGLSLCHPALRHSHHAHHRSLGISEASAHASGRTAA